MLKQFMHRSYLKVIIVLIICAKFLNFLNSKFPGFFCLKVTAMFPRETHTFLIVSFVFDGLLLFYEIFK